jgi:predicted DNA-binding transcriptional regulator AlpA
MRELMEKFGVKSRQTIYNHIKAGKIPQPVKKMGSPRWNEDELDKNGHKVKN